MSNHESDVELDTAAAPGQPVQLTAPEDLKAKECVERQVEMDAIATYGNQQEFPALAGAFVDPAARDLTSS